VSASAVNIPALWLAVAIALAITAVVILAQRGGSPRRGWIAAGALAALLLVLGLVDLQRGAYRDTHLAAPVLGALLPVLGATGLALATRRLRPWLQWTVVFVAAFLLLFGGLLLGAAVLPRFLS
jgi:hypothetical protein